MKQARRILLGFSLLIVSASNLYWTYQANRTKHLATEALDLVKFWRTAATNSEEEAREWKEVAQRIADRLVAKEWQEQTNRGAVRRL